jgi:hypothetical protein
VARLVAVIMIVFSFAIVTSAQDASVPTSAPNSVSSTSGSRHHKHHASHRHGNRHHGKYYHSSQAANSQ